MVSLVRSCLCAQLNVHVCILRFKCLHLRLNVHVHYMGKAIIKAYAWYSSYIGKGITETPMFEATVSYETGKWKYFKLFLFFITISAN